jgi:hypothetical protein
VENAMGMKMKKNSTAFYAGLFAGHASKICTCNHLLLNL